MKPLFLFAILYATVATAATLPVGPGQTYATLSAAVAVVQPGDTIELHAGVYPGGLFFAGLQGTPAAWITIRAAAGETVIFEGGNNAVQLADPAYLRIEGLTFRHQTGNGFNTDDGGSYDTPAHHVVFENCTFRDIAATGNNDLLKLSGLDSFAIRHCTFLNGAAGGSGIDMVGCHYGVIEGCTFENLGSNSIQAKGGTQYLRIERNFFRNGGQRTLNLGGSTGLEFFRPDTAHFEAADIRVYSNVIVGSWAAVAYVGAVNVEVVNNTIYQPENWVVRILQETVDPDRFFACGNNTFVNNLIVAGANLNTAVNIGPNTAPATFLFSHNLWYKPAAPAWTPVLPVPDPAPVVQTDPLLTDPANGDFTLSAGSSAIAMGLAVAAPLVDFYGAPFGTPRSIGAVEAEGATTSTGTVLEDAMAMRIFPNPTRESAVINLVPAAADGLLIWHDGAGRTVRVEDWPAGSSSRFVERGALPAGTYFITRHLPGQPADSGILIFMN